MSKKSTKALIKKMLSDLDWPILESPTDMPMPRIISDARNKSHFLYLPNQGTDESGGLDYLHELGHATLCERVHAVFATNSVFPNQANKKRFLQMLPALGTASDWFVCHWQQELVPGEMHRIIKKSMPLVAEILGKPELPPIEIILDSALLVAQAVHYLDEPIDCDGVLQHLVGAFLSIPPEEPSAENLQLLINKLMSTYTPERVRLVPEDACRVWDIFEPGDAGPAAAGSGSQAGAAL